MSEIYDIPHIRQTIFHVNKDLKYNIDVNYTITFHDLKRMIAAAARLNKNSFRIYHENEDLTDYEDITLDFLFPNDPVIEFTLFIDNKKDDHLTESVIKLKLNEYCVEHKAKYLSYYCYTCQLSICSLCYKTEHSDHQVMEKFDYLQPSRMLMDKLLGDENRFKADESIDQSVNISELKKKLSVKFFSQLHELLNEIEAKVNDVIDYFNNSVNTTRININENANEIKDMCALGLDKLKEDISIEKLIIREDIFLTFDKKYKELLTEEQRFKDDNIKYLELNNNYGPIETMVHNIYNEIFHVLSKNVESQLYNEIKNNISQYIVKKISKEEIMSKIFSEVGVPRKSLLKKSYIGVPEFNSASSKPLRDNGTNIPISAFGKEREIEIPISQTQPTMAEAYKRALLQTAKSIEENIKIQSKDDTDIKKPTKVVSVIYPYENSNQISYEMENGQKIDINVAFPSLSIIKVFPEKSSHCNYQGKLYITGGIDPISKAETNCALMFEPSYKNVVMIPSMTKARSCHSMIGNEEYIYVVGGYKTNTCEKFNLFSQTWETMPSLSLGERMHPILFVYNKHLFAFFGHSSDKYLDTVERINLSSPNAKWEIVAYNNPDHLDLKMYGCGIVPMKDQIFFFGGKTENDIMRKVFSFLFDTNTFLECPDQVDYAVYFKENLLHPLLNDQYGNINEGDKNALCLQVKVN